MTEAGVWNCLDVSTGHITRTEMDSIESCPVRVSRHEHGAILFLERADDGEGWRGHPNVLRLVQKALARDCSLVNLDGDGHEHDDLPRFDW